MAICPISCSRKHDLLHGLSMSRPEPSSSVGWLCAFAARSSPPPSCNCTTHYRGSLLKGAPGAPASSHLPILFLCSGLRYHISAISMPGSEMGYSKHLFLPLTQRGFLWWLPSIVLRSMYPPPFSSVWTGPSAIQSSLPVASGRMDLENRPHCWLS